MSAGLLVFDIDGTLVPHNGQPDPELLPVLQACEQKGYEIILATARRRSSARMRLAEIAEHYLDGAFNNGACTWEGQELISAGSINTEQAQLAFDHMRQHPHAYCSSIALADERIAFSRTLSTQELQDWGVSASDLCSIDQAFASQAIRLCTWSETHDISELYEALLNTFGHSMHWRLVDRGYCLFGTAPGLDKAAAVQAWCQRKGYTAEQVFAFGDDVSDISLLQWAGQGIAVSDGHPDVLATTSMHCAPCAQAGVAHWLKQHLL